MGTNGPGQALAQMARAGETPAKKRSTQKVHTISKKIHVSKHLQGSVCLI